MRTAEHMPIAAGEQEGGDQVEASHRRDCSDVLGPCGRCDFSALLLQRLVEGQVLINNVYFAASLDSRLRYQEL